MSNAHNVALAFLASQNVTEQVALDAQKPTFTVKVTKDQAAPKKVKAKKDKSPIHAAPTMSSVPGLALPEKGSLDATSFMAAMRNAGKRTVDGKVVYQERESHNDQIVAIAGYIGYDNRQSFGSQESAARTMAMRILNAKPDAGPSRAEERAADLSAKGFIAGLPAPLSSKLGDLQGRERIAAEAMIAHEKDAANLERSESDRELSDGLAAVERERLAVIRADIQRLSFNG